MIVAVCINLVAWSARSITERGALQRENEIQYTIMHVHCEWGPKYTVIHCQLISSVVTCISGAERETPSPPQVFSPCTRLAAF